MSDAIIGLGTTIAKGDGGAPEVFAVIAEVISIDGPSLDSDDVEVTHLLSPGGYREYKGGLKEPGEIALELNFLPGNASQDAVTGLIKEYNDQTYKNYKITWPFTPAKTCVVSARVKTMGSTTPVDDRLTASVTLKLSGPPVWA